MRSLGEHYQLIDFGNGRKLESFAGRIVDRPCVAAERSRRECTPAWGDAASVFDGQSKTWRHVVPWPESLSVDCGGFKMPVRPTPFGHVGLFPEQADNWRWLRSANQPEGTKALNLFAYTGASTMALVAAGFAVAHVDAAKQNVDAARQAASLNQWEARPVRYLVDDAAQFAAREVRRGRQYHTIVLDPPAYGHGPKGNAWRLERDLWPLLDLCLQLVTPSGFRLLITGHSEQVGAADVSDYLQQTEHLSQQQRAAMSAESGRSQLTDRAGRLLDAGFFVRAALQ